MFSHSDGVVVPAVPVGVSTEQLWLVVAEQIYFYWSGKYVVDIAAQKTE